MFNGLKRKVAALIQRQVALGSGSEEIRSTLRQLSSAHDAFRLQVETSLYDLSVSQEAFCRETEASLEELSFDQEALHAQIDALARQLSAASGEVDSTREACDATRAELDGLRMMLQSLQNRPDNLLHLYRVDREELLRRLTVLQREIAEPRHEMRRHLEELSRATLLVTASRETSVGEIRQTLADCAATNEQIRAAARQLVGTPQKYAYIGDHLAIATTIHGHRLFVDTRDRQIAPHLMTLGLWEPWNGRIFQALLAAGDTVVDVGSNVGYFVTLAAQLVGASGRVLALEANPAIANLLAASVEINGFAGQVEVVPAAAYDGPGTARFTTYANHHGDGHVNGEARVHDHAGADTIEVPTNALDAMIAGRYGNVRLLHIDAEGSEPAILRGAKHLIERNPRLVILMEWGLQTQGQYSELDWLASIGFHFARVEHDMTFTSCEIGTLAQSGLCDILCFRGEMPIGPR